MKSTVYHYYSPKGKSKCTRTFTVKSWTLISAIYSLNISILVVLLYSWQISVNMKKFQSFGDVYYGVQIAYYAIIFTQFSMMVLSVLLAIGTYTENAGLVVPFVIGMLTFMSFEALGLVYANVLKDQIFGHFDVFAKRELMAFLIRLILNTLVIWVVMKFYHMLRSGISWKLNETIIEL
ncbi:uncharacterized protein [Chironomus tepperi]|uniref:uncharacterized protein isoform X1 n=1 Tax=Chironomus tepperi TaxID=113505 RepID=UPI00391F6163